jgi:hypothetical protein
MPSILKESIFRSMRRSDAIDIDDPGDLSFL